MNSIQKNNLGLMLNRVAERISFYSKILWNGWKQPSSVVPKNIPTTFQWNDTILASLFLLISIAIVSFIVTILNYKSIMHAYTVTYNYYPFFKNRAIMAPDILLPWNRLFFPIIWVLIMFIIAMFRKIALILIGEKFSLPLLLTVHSISFIPVFIAAGISAIMDNLFPSYPDKHMGLTSWVSILMFILLMVAIFFEIKRMHKVLTENFSFSSRSSIFVSISPFVLGIFLTGILLILFYIYLLGYIVFKG
jgi:hypothetical protein